MFSTMDSNDLGALKKYLDTGKSGVEQYTNAIEYKYSVSPQIYKENKDSIRQVNRDQSFSAMGLGSSISTNSMMSSMMSTDVFMRCRRAVNFMKISMKWKRGIGRRDIMNVLWF